MEKAFIENRSALRDGAVQGALGTCHAIASQHVSNDAAPVVKVSCPGIKLRVYLCGECNKYYEHSWQIGKCSTGMPPSTCDQMSASEDARFDHYQSSSLRRAWILISIYICIYSVSGGHDSSLTAAATTAAAITAGICKYQVQTYIMEYYHMG